MVDHAASGTVESILNFCHFTLNDDKLLDFLDYFEERGIGVTNASPLSMGLLSQRGVPSWHPAPASLVEACRRAVEHCSAKGYPIEKLAMQFSAQDGSSLPDSYIYDIQEAMDGSLWINTAQGICVYHPRTETFERDMHQVYTPKGASLLPISWEVSIIVCQRYPPISR